MRGTIEIFVPDTTGDAEISVKGLKGPGCMALTAEAEAHFGADERPRELTSEYEEKPEAQVDNDLRLGR